MNSKRDPKIKTCPKCHRKFHVKSSYYKHVKKCDGLQEINTSNFICQEDNCNYSSNTSKDLIHHLQSVHETDVPVEQFSFETYSEFESWKENLEKNTISRFILRNSRKNARTTVDYYYCNRSGCYASVSTGKRIPKSQGPNKIGFGCLASIKATRELEKVCVVFCSFHYGHENKFSHIPLSKGDKQSVASQLMVGIPHHQILRNNFDGEVEKLERKHLMTKQDIVNISKTIGLVSEQKHPEDGVSVEVLFKENTEKQNIILYKRQGEEGVVFPEDAIENTLEKNDFAFGIMTDFQKKMISKFGNNIVCLDATHNTNYYSFNLITILVVDEFQEGIPVAWLISNRENSVVLRLFFEAIKKALGNIISPKLIMTDNAPQYYNSWVHVFGSEPKKLICHWHVHHDWMKNLNKIKDSATSRTVYKGLCLLLEEGDIDKFEAMLIKCLSDFQENPSTQAFGEYFRKEWVCNKAHWAKCFRKNSTINTNMYLESFHKTLKYGEEYFKKKQGRRLDKCIEILFQFAKDMSIKRLVKLEKGKNNKKMTDISKRHKNSSVLSSELVSKTSDRTWEVKCSKSILADTTALDSVTYKVTQNNMCELNCRVKCLKCNICIHSYSCDCPDGLTSSTICKHVHLVVRGIKQDPLEQVERNNLKCSLNALLLSTAEEEQNELLLKSVNPDHQNDLKTLKENLLKKYSELKDKIEACQNRELLIAARQHINNISNILDLPLTNSKLVVEQKVSQPVIANNKNTVKQYRFFSTRKQRRNHSTKYAKPTFEEKCDLENSLLGSNSKVENQNDHTYGLSASCDENILCTPEPDKTSKIPRAAAIFLGKFASSEIVKNVSDGRKKIEETQIEVVPEKVSDSVIDTNSEVLQVAREYVTSDAWLIISSVLDLKKKSWSCASCTSITTKQKMICCDKCEKWFHWKCQKLKKEPSQKNWFCNNCSGALH